MSIPILCPEGHPLSESDVFGKKLGSYTEWECLVCRAQWKERQGSEFVEERPAVPGKTASVQGIPSFRQFVAELGGPEYFLNHLKVEFDIQEEDEGEVDMKEAKRRFEEAAEFFASMRWPIDIYRAITLHGGEARTDSFGTSWSLSEGTSGMEYGAFPYGSPSRHYRVYQARVGPEVIDWVSTLGMAMSRWWDTEQEVRVKDDAKLTIRGWKDSKDEEWQQGSMTVTASAEGPVPEWFEQKFSERTPEERATAWASIVRNRPQVAEGNLQWAKEHGVEITPEGRLVLYHGTQSGEAIMESGYLKAHSYLATTPEVAKRFGMAAGGRRNIQVIRVEVDPGKGFLHGDGYFSANEPIDIRGKGTEYVQDRV